MESEEGGHVTQVWKQPVSRGDALDMRHMRKQLGIHNVETIGGQQSCLVVKERVISWGRKAVDTSLSH